MISTTRPPVELERPDDPAELVRARRDRVRFLDVPERTFLAVTGTEAPGSEAYMGAVGSLYPVAYTLHFMLRRRGVRGRVGMLEGLYWLTPEQVLDGESPGERLMADAHFRWQLLLSVPPEASELEIEEAIREASARRRLPALDRLRVIHWAEGPAAQVLHVGPYERETETIRRLHDAILGAGYEPHGEHHEIYLNNPQEVGAEKAKTVLRRPIRLPQASNRR